MPKTVYHYTTPEGVYSILKEKKLWFTDCQYLNDKNELVYILEPFREACGKFFAERGKSVEYAEEFAYDIMDSPFSNFVVDNRPIGKVSQSRLQRGFFLKEYRYYAFCTSRSSDSTSMWNYYVKNGMYRGYNLGIDIHVIEEWFSQYGGDAVKLVCGSVIYKKEIQIQLLYEKAKELFGIYDETVAQCPGDSCLADHAKSALTADLSAYINEKKLFFKHPAFESEQEYRFVLKIHNGFSKNNPKKEYRVGTSGIITPYVEWGFGDLKARLLKQITLSPMIEEELAKESFERFLQSEGLENIAITPSTIKLRF